ncbi:MAG: hypothetical protein DMF77_11740 [Acidobacteria bacterium]|nr:MAG: hypothetical protein DMF77_11740 [Acidobacteriota bacterium]
MLTKGRSVLAALAAASVAVALLPMPAAGADLCQGLIGDRAPHASTPLAKPALGKTVVDPEFGTRIRRITAVGPASGDAVIKPMYSTTSAWNADESKMILYHVGRGHELYDGRTYAFIRALPIAPADIEQVYWHTSDPDVFFFPTGNRLVRYHVATGAQDTVHTFGSCTDSLTAGSDPMFMAWDSSAIGLACGNQSFLYRIATDTMAATAATAGDPPQVAPSGTLAVVAGNVLDLALRPLRRLDLANPFDHAALGRNLVGHDTYNSVAYDPGPAGSGIGSLVTFDLVDGQSRVVVGPATGFPYPPSGTHVSTLAYRQPGWTFLSIVGDPAGRGVLDNELVLADTNTGTVCRAAHHRSWGDNNTRLRNSYWAEPHVVASPSGTRAVFASDWGNGATVDSYVLELPAYQPIQMSVTTNSATYVAGSTMTVSLRLTSFGWPETADLYVLQVSPDGNQVLDFTPAGVLAGQLAQPSALVPLVSRLDLRPSFDATAPTFYTRPWNGNDVPGTYLLIMAAVRPGTLADNRFDVGDVLAAGATRITFAR